MDAVGADRGRDARAGPVRERECDAVRVLRQADQLLAQMDGSLRQRRLERGKEIGPVHRQLRRAIALLGGAAHLEARGFRAAVPDAAHPVGRAARSFADALAEAQPRHRLDGIGREIDGGADALELRRLLEHVDGDADARQGVRRGEAADAGADHRNSGRRSLAQAGSASRSRRAKEGGADAVCRKPAAWLNRAGSRQLRCARRRTCARPVGRAATAACRGASRRGSA